MNRLAPCPACGRHVVTTDEACPFCAHAFVNPPAPQSGDWARKLGRVGVIAAMASMSACAAAYGGPPEEDGGVIDDGGTEDDAGLTEDDAGS